jgi:Proteasome subunit
MTLLLERNVIGGVAGLTADANSLINFARTAAQNHLLMYNQDIPVELMAQTVCNMKQGYTQFGGELVLSFRVIIYNDRMIRSPTFWCLSPLRRLRLALPIPALPFRPFR